MNIRKVEEHIRGQIADSDPLRELDTKQLLCFGVTGLNEEAGEVAGLLCREVYKNREMDKELWLEELGDVFWYLVVITMSKGLTLEDLWKYNTEKLERRYGNGCSKQSETL